MLRRRQLCHRRIHLFISRFGVGFGARTRIGDRDVHRWLHRLVAILQLRWLLFQSLSDLTDQIASLLILQLNLPPKPPNLTRFLPSRDHRLNLLHILNSSILRLLIRAFYFEF